MIHIYPSHGVGTRTSQSGSQVPNGEPIARALTQSDHLSRNTFPIEKLEIGYLAEWLMIYRGFVMGMGKHESPRRLVARCLAR